jgi:hypothetical protein
LFAFIEVEDIIFGERSSVVVDPPKKGRSEFAGVRRTISPASRFVLMKWSGYANKIIA